MTNIRRFYIFIVAAISLNAVTWALISLLRNLFTPELSPLFGSITLATDLIALQLAIIIIGLPIYLVHWLWAERLAREDQAEHEAILRRLYLYVMMSAFLIPLIANTFGFVQSALRLLFGVRTVIPSYSARLPDDATLVYTAVALLVLACLIAYHYWVTNLDKSQILETDSLAIIHRLFVYLFSFTGLVLLTIGSGSLLRWLLFQFDSQSVVAGDRALATTITQLIVGLGVWIYFWREAGRMFTFGKDRERTSALRKFYLYLVIFLAALSVVTSLTTILAGLFKELLSVASTGDIRDVLTVLVIGAIVWAYHFFVLRQDTRLMPEVEQQAGVRRLYWYLIGGIGLMALLIGVGGIISLIINTGGSFIANSYKEQLSWFTAVTLAGLVVWIIPWQKIQAELTAAEPTGSSARSSLVRRLYLYFYLLIATLTFLGAGIYIVFEILYLIMGGRSATNLAGDLAQALAYALMAVAVWVYHGRLLRQDNAVLKEIDQTQAGEVHVAVVDDEDGRFGEKLIAAIHKAVPNAILHPIGLTAAANEALHTADEPLPAGEVLKSAQIIVGPWTIATPYVVHGETDMEMLAAVSASPGHKLLIPKPEQGWDWAGMGKWNAETAVKQTINAVKQIIAGQAVNEKKGINISTVIAIAVGVFILLNLLPILLFLPSIFFGF